MSYDRDDYWRECVEIALADAGVEATPEQVKEIAYAVQGGAENIGQAFYSPSTGEHERMESDRLGRELKAERDKVACADCGGSGRLIYNSGPLGVNSHCDRCKGEGRHTP